MRAYEYTSFEDIKKIASAKTKFALKCKCGHSLVMSNAERTICNWCGSWVYRTPQIEFKYKLMKKIKEDK